MFTSCAKGDHLLLLDRAIDLLPKSRLYALVADHVKPEELKPDKPDETSFVEQVKAFCDASLRGEYYEGFAVNSKNCMVKSGRTDRFMVDCDRLLGLCVKHTQKGNHSEAAASFELIFPILRHIDECLDDVVFFADEGGSWQIGVDWRTVLPAWFKTMSPEVVEKDFWVCWALDRLPMT